MQTTPSADALFEFLVTRRSAIALDAPGPSDAQLERILAAAGTVPDHGQLRPFRFVVASGDGREAFGNALAEAARERSPELAEHKLAGVRSKAQRSPTLVALIASPRGTKIEPWEQVATAACAGYAIVLAAHALGVGAVWKSAPFTRGRGLNELLSLGESEEMLGWIHLGTSTRSDGPARGPLDVSAVTTVLDGAAPRPFGK